MHGQPHITFTINNFDFGRLSGIRTQSGQTKIKDELTERTLSLMCFGK